MISNKKIGSYFEQEFCEFLSKKGFWAHFINPNRNGSQPFDVIAVKDGIAYAFDCKTCVRESFSIARVEEGLTDEYFSDKYINTPPL